ncbi:MAG: penicillin-binding transpeptidase domain-containing protein [Chloroflexota bacterium]
MNGNPSASPALHNDIAPWRIWLFLGAVVLVLGVYILRLFNLQIVEGTEWLARADEQRTTTINLPAPRGIIYDRNGIILARNIPSYNIVVIPAYLPDDPGETQQSFRELSALIGVPVSLGVVDSATSPYVECKSEHGIRQIAEFGASWDPYREYPVKCNVDRTIAMVVEEKTALWPGIQVQVKPVRDYPTGVETANFIGYLGPIYPEVKEKYETLGFVADRDKIGYAGIELEFQDLLGGKNGQRTVEVDVGGQVLRDLVEPVDVVPGQNIRLTIDYRLQQSAYAIVTNELGAWNRIVSEDKQQTSAVVIAMNPQTGEILAMISYPSYENNRLAREISAYYYEQMAEDPRLPLLNHAVSDEVPVGSVFKIVTGVGALNEGVVTPEQFIETPGYIQLTEKFYENDAGRPKDFIDWINHDGVCPGGLNITGHCTQAGTGSLDFIHGIAYSSNVYFYKLGGGYKEEISTGLGICRLGTYARALGYDEPAGLELPAVADGLIPSPSWKRINQGQSWTTGDTYIASVGQGLVTATPLQVLMSGSVIAAGGKLWEPTIVREILSSDGKVVQGFTPALRWDLTVTPTIQTFDTTSIRDCEPTGELKTIEPWVFEKVREGMRLAVTDGTLGPLADEPQFNLLEGIGVAAAGKTGTAEYCDKYVLAKGLCESGKWPSHAWTVGFAPYNDPKIAVVAFVYNGNEGAAVAGPIVRRVMQAYFEIEAIDAELGR